MNKNMAKVKEATTTRTDEENAKLKEIIETTAPVLTKDDVVAAPEQYSVDKTETGHVVIDKFGNTVREYLDEDCVSEDCAKSYAEKLNSK